MSMQVATGTAATGAFSFFMPIEKIDKEKRTVSGYASTPSVDSDGEIVSLKAVKEALPGYMQYGNIREMHKISAVGVAKEANIDAKGLYLTAKIVDDAAWRKCQEGVYKGFSIGGQKLLKAGNVITKIDMAEISVVDRPANPDCKIDVIKMSKPVPEAEAVLVKVQRPQRSPEAKAALSLAKAVRSLVKGGDGLSSPAEVVAPEKEKPSPGAAALGKEAGTEVPVSPKAKIKKAKKEARERAANKLGKAAKVKVKYRDRMAKAFTAIETMDIAPTGPVRSAERGARSKSGASGSPFLSLKKIATGDLSVEPPPESLDFLTLPMKKGMGAASSLTYAFSSIREAQRSLMLEGRDEKDGKDQQLAKRLGLVAKELAGVIGDKALHEGEEAVTMTDTDDRWVNQSLGKAKKMSNGSVKQMIRGAVMEALLGTSSPEALAKGEKATMKDCLKGVKDNMKEAKKARKDAMTDIEKAHGMCKANYLAKAAKKPDDKEEPAFDEKECMKALSGAYASMQKAATFEKAAKEFLAKADSMASVSPTSGTADYVVPAGVKALSQSELAEGGPPPLYGSETVYPGKAQGAGDLAKYAKDGMVPVAVAELLARNSALEGQVEVLGNQPRGGRRPYGFNMQKALGGEGGAATTDAAKIIFDGVDVGAIGSGNEEMHKAASARALGNLLLAPKLAKSIMDPSFKGTAGVKH